MSPKLQDFRSYEVTNAAIPLQFFWKKKSQLQSYKVTRLRPKLPSIPSTYLAISSQERGCSAKILIWDDLALARPQKLSFEDVKVEF